MKRIGYILLLSVMAACIYGLSTCRFENSLIPIHNEDKLHIVRLDRMVDDYVNTGNVALWQRITAQCPKETRALIEDVLRLGAADTDGIEDSLMIFYSDASLLRLRLDMAGKFSDLSKYEKELHRAFIRLDKELPGFVIPKVYAQNSAFNQSIVVGDSLVGISLDKYMGPDYPAYRQIYDEQQMSSMNPSRIVQDCLIFYLNHCYPPHHPESGSTLGEIIIHQGKIAWIAAVAMGRKPTDMAGGTTDVKQWRRTHKKEIWEELDKPHVWNSTDTGLIQSVMFANCHPLRFTGPHACGIGLWAGIQKVDHYMQSHPKMSIDSLLKVAIP